MLQLLLRRLLGETAFVQSNGKPQAANEKERGQVELGGINMSIHKSIIKSLLRVLFLIFYLVFILYTCFLYFYFCILYMIIWKKRSLVVCKEEEEEDRDK